ncbi:MAG: Mrp/NBP35 family ATP-binding protein [Ruminococcus sp.]|nr:Mrp/NBP35 family ATP-binding protein [Ruminococcus sp.]
MSECSHDCSSCGANCSERQGGIPKEQMNPMSDIKKVIGIVSGKGGVGKSLVTSLLAVNAERGGFNAAILDADITGPSIPSAFGIHGRAQGTEEGLFPAMSHKGTKIMSINLLLENEGDPVVWRGPVIAGAVKQFWTDVIWDKVDFMFVDMPPGTGDVPLTVFQSLPIDGIIIVTSPQELVSMIVGKAVKMAQMMNIPVLGVVQNMSYFECPDCGKRHELFGESRIEAFAAEYGIDTVCRLPVAPKLAAACDSGTVELYEGDWLDPLSEKLARMIED